MTTLTSQLVVSLLDRVTAPSRAVTNSLAGLRAQVAQNARVMSDLRGSMVDAAAMGYVLARAISAPIKAATEFQSAMADINKVVDFDAPDGLSKMSKDILAMSREIPMAATGIAQIVAAAGQAGMAGNELLSFAEMAAKVGVAFDISGDEAGKSLAKIKTALGMTVPETSRLADAINHLSNTSAAAAPDLLDFMRRVGSSGKQFGFTAEQTAAIGAAMVAAGAQSEVAATSFQNVGKALARGASATPAQRRVFKQLGLNAKAVAKSLQKDAVGTLTDVIARIRKLPKEVQASAISSLFGDEARAIMPLIENADLLAGALGQVAEETNYLGSAQKEYEVRSQTFANALQLFQNRLDEVSIAIGNALLPALTRIMDAILPVISAVADLAAAYPQVTAAAVGLTAGMVGLRIATIATRYAFLFAKGGLLEFQIAALGGLAKIAAGGKAGLGLLAAPFVQYGNSARRAAAETAALAAAHVAQTQKAYAAAQATQVLARQGKVAGVSALTAAEAVKAAGHAAVKAQREMAAANAALAAFGASNGVGGRLFALLNPLRLVRAAFVALRVAIIGTGIGAAVVGLAMAGTWISNNWAGLSALFESFGAAFMRAIQPLMPALQPVADGIAKLKALWEQLTGTVEGGTGQWHLWGAQAGRAVGEFLVSVVGMPGKIADAVRSIDVSGLVSQFAEAGAKAGKALIDGIIKAFDDLWAWLAELPGRVVDAIGSIDLSGVIKLPSLWGGGDSAAATEAAESAISGARAAGGPIVGGRTYLVGEYGPELVTPSRSGHVHDADATRSMLGGARPVSVSFGSIVIQGVQDPEAIARHIGQRLREELAGLQADTAYSIG